MTTANRQENKKTYPRAPFYLAGLPYPLLSSQLSFRCEIVMWWRAMLSLHKAAKATCATPHSSLSFRALVSAYTQHKPQAYDIGEEQHGNGTFPPFFGFT